MEKERKKKQRIERVVKAIFLLILPLVTAALTAFKMADNGSVSEFLTINILTPMFVIWFLSLVIDILWNKYRCWKRKTVISVRSWIFYGVSLGMFLSFFFIQMFSKSILLGGFHAS